MNFLKKIIVSFLIVFLTFFFNLGLINFVFANENASTTIQAKNKNEETQKKGIDITFFQSIGQTMYAITWPLVIISAKFMDNQVVYGEFIGMDVMLWKIWNVMRTFANYIIGFLLITSIFTLFMGGRFEKLNPIKILPQLALSAILINASWFLVGVCIDISNILTYAVGALPLNIAKNNDLAAMKKPVPKFEIRFQANNDPVLVGVTDGNKFYPFCEVTALTGNIGYKLVPKNLGKENNQEIKACAYEYSGDFYKIDSPIEIKQGSNSNGDPVYEALKSKPKIETKVVKDIYEQEGISGILTTLFASILNLGRTVAYGPGPTTAMITDLIFKLIFLLVLLVPLFTLAIILIVRVVVIRFFIVASPLIFLFSTVDSLKSFLGEKTKLGSLCCMVFMPVFVVFALSISFIFLSSVGFETIKKDFNVGLSGDNVVIKIADGHEIKMKYFENGSDSAGTDLFAAFANTIAWFIKLAFSVGFMWIIVFTALKSCKITQGIAMGIQKFSQDLVKAAPIIPVAGGQSISSLAKGIQQIEQLPQQKQSEQYKDKFAPLLEELNRKMTGVEKKAIASANTELPKKLSEIKQPSKINIDQLPYSGTITEDLLNNKDNKLTELAQKLGTNVKVLKDVLSAYKDKRFSDIKGKLSSELEQKIKEAYNNKLKSLIKSYTLDKQITLMQLNDIVKQEIAKKLGIKKGVISKDKEVLEEIINKLTDIGFSEEEIMKLLASNLEGGNIPSKEKDEIEKLIKEVLSKKKKSKSGNST